MLLTEKYQDLLESSKFKSLKGTDSAAMALMLEQTEKEMNQMISEGTLSGDVAQFTPILMPLVRRVYPQLIANELLGVQPMTMSTGYIYALINQYVGDGDTNGISPLSTSAGLGGQIVVLSITATDGLGYKVGSVITGTTSTNTGTIIYVEGTKALVKITSGEALEVEATTSTQADGTTASTDVADITAIYTNEASFGQILKNYTGSYTTAQAEVLGKDMKEIGFSISRKSVEAVSRALKGQYTVEMYQDLQKQHGLLADEEIMSLMSYELQAEIDREIVSFVNTNAEAVPNASNISFTASSDDGTGRWEIEKYRREVIKIAKESKVIGINTKRGQGNTIIASPQVVTMLEQVGRFKNFYDSTVDSPVSGGVAGMFDNKFKVIVDQYATSDYATVLYKGADRRDAMGFFAPYVPLSFTKVTNQDSGQPAVIAKTRYALSTIPGLSSATSNDRAQKYARTFGVTFTNTALA